MGRHDPKLSPFEAVTRVLERWFGIKNPTNVAVMDLIDAVRDTTPPPREVTINMLSKILQSLEPTEALDAWATRSSREIVKILSQHPTVKQAAKLIDNEHLWCSLEGTLAGMLSRVCRGQDLEDPIKTQITAPWTDEQVKALNRYQKYSPGHPFTGERNPDGSECVLIATNDGWVRYKGGPVVQTWAWEFMAQKRPKGWCDGCMCVPCRCEQRA